MSQSPNPFAEPGAPNWSSDYFREPVPAGVSPLGRGLVGHVPLVAICLIVQGVLEILFGLFLIACGLFFMLSGDPELAGMQPLAMMFIGVSLPALLCGLLRLVAGIFNLRYRSRILGMAALCVGLLTMITGYCAISSMALAVYGLIVYLNDSVVAAFAMGDSGKSGTDIQAAFPAGR